MRSGIATWPSDTSYSVGGERPIMDAIIFGLQYHSLFSPGLNDLSKQFQREWVEINGPKRPPTPRIKEVGERGAMVISMSVSVCVCLSVCACKCACVCVCVLVSLCVRAYLRTCMWVYERECMCVGLCVCVCAVVWNPNSGALVEVADTELV